MKKIKAETITITCPYCKSAAMNFTYQVCPNCGCFVYEFLKQVYFMHQNNGQQSVNNISILQPYLGPTFCEIKKLKNAFNTKSNLKLYKFSYLEISYNMLLILGRKSVVKPEDYSYDNTCYSSDGGIAEAALEVAAEVFVEGVIDAFTPADDFNLVIGLHPEHIRNLSFREAKKGVNMIVEMYDGNLLEIKSNQECYNKVTAWWQNNRAKQY